jgi:hypothetical protein
VREAFVVKLLSVAQHSESVLCDAVTGKHASNGTSTLASADQVRKQSENEEYKKVNRGECGWSCSGASSECVELEVLLIAWLPLCKGWWPSQLESGSGRTRNEDGAEPIKEERNDGLSWATQRTLLRRRTSDSDSSHDCLVGDGFVVG